MPTPMIPRSLVLFSLTLVPRVLAAQGAEPLRKTDVVRLLSNPVIPKTEVADLIRRNCLAFQPSERDWADLRALGASADVLASIGGCKERHAPPAAAATAPLVASALTTQVDAPAGGEANVAILFKRAGLVRAGIDVLLRGQGFESGATTDENGIARFHFLVGRRAGTFTLSAALPAGAAITNARPITLVVHPGPPAVATVQPVQLDLITSPSDGPLTVTAVVADTFGNTFAREAVQLRGDPLGSHPISQATDSSGAVVFSIPRSAIRRAGTLAVVIRGDRLAQLPVIYSDEVSDTRSGFQNSTVLDGIVRKRLSEPLVFEVRSMTGRPLSGRLVAFRGDNADVTPDSALTDSAGRARVTVTLGMLAGTASVTGIVDSVRKSVSLRVEPSADAVVMIEQNGIRVDGGNIVVPVDTPFALRVSARDAYGNPLTLGSLVRGLEQMRQQFNVDPRLLRIVRVDSSATAATLTFFPAGIGKATLKIADASVSVAVVRARTATH
ncbi:MAG TPA: Ig-like domain-containing protein [Gemmatimonadales bacterium]|nr:Ig-like domain-containing protein [Gemmatimonadales bacterium]